MNSPSVVRTVDAPIEGWDAFHSLDDMPASAAIILDNLIPGAGTVDTRGGYSVFADVGTGLPVETVASLQSATNTKLLAASNGGMWEIETGTPTELIAAATFSNNRWQYTNFRKSDETGVIVLCNGTDKPRVFSTGPDTVTAIDSTGTTDPSFSDDFIGCVTFKGRVYYWLDNDDAFWYTQAGSYQGEFRKFDLGSVVQRGGKIVTVATWTQQDSGDGKDDFIVFVFSTGEILVYQGDDPDNAGFFEMIGRYITAEPLSVRGTSQYGADAILMTKDGYVSLSTIIQEGRTSDVPQFSRLIHTAVTQRTATRSEFFGWDCELFPKQGLFVFNVPLSDTTFEQHVMNTVTLKWCRFKDLNVNCITVHNERLFGGTENGLVHALLEGTSDSGNAINFTGMPAFNYLDAPGYNKHITAAQLRSTHSRPVDIQLSGYADYQVPEITPVVLPVGTDQATWSINPPTPPQELGSFWDEDFWGGGSTALSSKGWQNVSAFGEAVTVLVRFAKINEPVTWRSTNLRFFMAGAQ
jgi:hypothetical protein